MYYQIKGLVLNSKIKGEADKVAIIYTYQWGKISVIVPGAKKIAAKLNSATEPLTESEFMVCQNDQSMRPKVIGASIINFNADIKSDYNKNIYALYAAEISDKLLPYNSENIQKYNLISRIWEILAKCSFHRRAVAAFILRFLSLSGYAFSDYIKQGYISIDEDTIHSINKLSNCSGNDIDSLSIDDERIYRFVEEYLQNYISKPRVLSFIQKTQ
jgi:DNA repair protein RecO (recombination protein O)